MSVTQDLLHVQIVVNITFDANGEDHEWLRSNAHKTISREFGNGGITGGTDAVVEDYDIKATIVKEAAATDAPTDLVSPAQWMEAGLKAEGAGMDPDLKTQRDLLARAIAEAAIKRGIWTSSSAQYACGPNLIAVLNDLASEPSPALQSPLSPAAEKIDENSIKEWLSSQINGGHMELERLPMLMARYALTDPAQMREEIAERMQNFEAENDSESHNQLNAERPRG